MMIQPGQLKCGRYTDKTADKYGIRSVQHQYEYGQSYHHSSESSSPARESPQKKPYEHYKHFKKHHMALLSLKEAQKQKNRNTLLRQNHP